MGCRRRTYGGDSINLSNIIIPSALEYGWDELMPLSYSSDGMKTWTVASGRYWIDTSWKIDSTSEVYYTYFVKGGGNIYMLINSHYASGSYDYPQLKIFSLPIDEFASRLMESTYIFTSSDLKYNERPSGYSYITSSGHVSGQTYMIYGGEYSNGYLYYYVSTSEGRYTYKFNVSDWTYEYSSDGSGSPRSVIGVGLSNSGDYVKLARYGSSQLDYTKFDGWESWINITEYENSPYYIYRSGDYLYTSPSYSSNSTIAYRYTNFWSSYGTSMGSVDTFSDPLGNSGQAYDVNYLVLKLHYIGDDDKIYAVAQHNEYGVGFGYVSGSKFYITEYVSGFSLSTPCSGARYFRLNGTHILMNEHRIYSINNGVVTDLSSSTRANFSIDRPIICLGD